MTFNQQVLEPTAFPLRARGRQFEDFQVGRHLDHHWGRTLTMGDAALFATVTLSYNPLYFNAEYAGIEGHPGMVIHPMLALCTVVGLSVEDLSEAGGPFLGIDELSFHRPVYPGDTLRATSTVIDKRPSKKQSGFGIVAWRTEGRNQNGELVVSFTRANLVLMREAQV
ncbi:MaoC family dehydratase [Nocardia pseudovaccinii]|uniref:MaoC family dehydratase n=1 Tax=Nocardia pseudovaccinii TaxID=189540 RepID=UPI0007A4057A|nr:MaoC family dehydratase [Nocardia pseudovaccinii]